MAGGGEDAHVGADLGDDGLGGALLRRRGSCTAAQRPARKGASCSSIASESRSICSSRKSRWARIAPISSACSASKRPSSASLQRRDLRAQLALGQLGEHARVGRARDRARRASPGRRRRGCRWRRSRA